MAILTEEVVINDENPKLRKLRDILQMAADNNASDIHLAPRSPIAFRIDGDLVRASELLPPPENQDPNKTEMATFEIDELVEVFLDEEKRAYLKKVGEIDFAYSVDGFSRMRLNVFRQRGTYAIAIRILSYEVPSPDVLGIPESIMNLGDLKRGLVLVTGATGSGKSTTLAALISKISKTYKKNIITLEDPIEYLHRHSKSIVLQREVGFDTQSYANALRAALRQDPDVILVGEMRDLETIQTAITAAETGHLVFSTLHTNSTSASIDRMIDVFPPHQQQQIRVQLSVVLEAVIAQQLLPLDNGGGRKAAFEILLANMAIRNLIREGKTFQIPSVIQTSKKEGMQTMDDDIYGLYMRGLINAETAYLFAFDQTAMKDKVGYTPGHSYNF